MAVSVSPVGSGTDAASSARSEGRVTVTTPHPLPPSRGAGPSPELRPHGRVQSPGSQGSTQGASWVGTAPSLQQQRTARPHTHRSLSWPLSGDSCSPRSSSGNWQLQVSSAGGRASRSSWVSGGHLRCPLSCQMCRTSWVPLRTRMQAATVRSTMVSGSCGSVGGSPGLQTALCVLFPGNVVGYPNWEQSDQGLQRPSWPPEKVPAAQSTHSKPKLKFP